MHSNDALGAFVLYSPQSVIWERYEEIIMHKIYINCA